MPPSNNNNNAAASNELVPDHVDFKRAQPSSSSPVGTDDSNNDDNSAGVMSQSVTVIRVQQQQSTTSKDGNTKKSVVNRVSFLPGIQRGKGHGGRACGGGGDGHSGNNTNSEKHGPMAASTTTICNVNDYQSVAKTKIPKSLYEYLSSGTDDEQTLSENRSAFKLWYLRPRVCKPGLSRISTSTTLFGHKLSMPVFTSPAGVQALCDPAHGECATARAAARMGTMFALSQHATRSIEDISREAPALRNKWFQAYILKDRATTLRLVRRAVKAGYTGIFLTVDSVRFGYREADARNGFNALPPPHRLVNYDEPSSESFAGGNDTGGVGGLEKTYNGKEKESWDQNSEMMFDQDTSWDDVAWLKREACGDLPLVIKGIMTAEDATCAVEAGADGVMVSNHGGRGLDGCLSSIDALPEVVSAVGGRVPVLLDGGVRRGTDVLKALALGASAVGIGKPVFFALACGGEEAVVRMLDMFRTEIEAAMAICGLRSVRDITKNLVTRHPSGGALVKYIRSSL